MANLYFLTLIENREILDAPKTIMTRWSTMRERTRLNCSASAIAILLTCTACSSGFDEGGTLAGHWSGSITCEGAYAYSYGFDLDGAGDVSGVGLRSTFLFSACPGGPATVTCNGSGTYTYTKSGAQFEMEVSYSGCKCGGVNANLLNNDSFAGTFNGSNKLSGGGSCSFSFRR